MSVKPQPSQHASQHYENFPVAYKLFPKDKRRAVELIYQFARMSDDIADEGEHDDNWRIDQLNFYDAELTSIANKETPQTTFFRNLQTVIENHNLPVICFKNLLIAFKQDVSITRYKNLDELHNYCQYSAEPVGQIMLHLFNQVSEKNIQQANQICTALQLINFIQDIHDDLVSRNRVYLTQQLLNQYCVSENDLIHKQNLVNLHKVITEHILDIEQLLLPNFKLADNLNGVIGHYVKLVNLCALRVVQKLKCQRYPFANSKLNTKDKIIVIFFKWLPWAIRRALVKVSHNVYQFSQTKY